MRASGHSMARRQARRPCRGASEPHDHLNIANHAKGSLLNESYVNGFGEVGVKTWGQRAGGGSAGGIGGRYSGIGDICGR